MEATTVTARPGWRQPVLLLLVFGPAPGTSCSSTASPSRRIPGFHLFADIRTCLGLKNFGNVASNLLFLVVGAIGMAWCYRNAAMTARRSWFVFFLGVALVFFGSGYYHYKPNDDSLVWDRLPMTIAFMGLFAALLSEHLSDKHELARARVGARHRHRQRRPVEVHERPARLPLGPGHAAAGHPLPDRRLPGAVHAPPLPALRASGSTGSPWSPNTSTTGSTTRPEPPSAAIRSST